VLKAVADALRDSCREYDYVARLGGDEFVLVLPGSGAVALKKRIPQFRQIGARTGAVVAGLADLTMSVGVAFFPQDAPEPEKLLAEADRRMYRDKELMKAHRFRKPLNEAEAGLKLAQPA
jgi:diguanylate cyclase (GGDEF)-like protein